LFPVRTGSELLTGDRRIVAGASDQESEGQQAQGPNDGFLNDQTAQTRAKPLKTARNRVRKIATILANPLEPQMSTINRRTGSERRYERSHGRIVRTALYRDNLTISFALFRRGQWKPVLDTFIQERPSGHVSDSLLPAMDREANRVSHEVNKN
jgi:hypothetical protein